MAVVAAAAVASAQGVAGLQLPTPPEATNITRSATVSDTVAIDGWFDELSIRYLKLSLPV